MVIRITLSGIIDVCWN